MTSPMMVSGNGGHPVAERDQAPDRVVTYKRALSG
jgi:hypothetical protein